MHSKEIPFEMPIVIRDQKGHRRSINIHGWVLVMFHADDPLDMAYLNPDNQDIESQILDSFTREKAT
jgi:hypothetical protein